jgi:hypothetical protein
MLRQFLETMIALWTAVSRWEGFNVEPAGPDMGTLFGLAPFVSTLALLVVVLNVADYRYRFRLSVRKYNLRRVGFVVSGLIAFGLLLTDVWFNNRLPILHCLNNYNNITSALAFVFIVSILRVVQICFVSPAQFNRRNAKRFANVVSYEIHQGNKERLATVADEMRPALKAIFACACAAVTTHPPRVVPDHQGWAHDLLLVLADQRFCALIVDRLPVFALQCFELAIEYPNVPFAQLSRNIGQEFILNTNSAFYQEESGFRSGYFGIAKPVTSLVYGTYSLVERCANAGSSSLEIQSFTRSGLDAEQMEGFTRAGLAFLRDYLKETSGRKHSYALARLLDEYKNCLFGSYRLDSDADNSWDSVEFARVRKVAEFITSAIEALAAAGIQPRTKRPSNETYHDLFDSIANLTYEMVLAVSAVSKPRQLCWALQHNTVWNCVFGVRDNYAFRAVQYKLRRLMFDEIRKMDKFPNFVGGQILGFCLNVLGLSPGSRGQTFGRQEYALRVCAIKWAKKNYTRLLVKSPNVAKVCLQGAVTYETSPDRLIWTSADATKATPRTTSLELNEFSV